MNLHLITRLVRDNVGTAAERALQTCSPVRIICFLGFMGSFTMALWMPPFAGPDEAAHWFRAVHVSSGHVLADKDHGQLGARLPVWSEDLFTAIPASGLSQHQRVTEKSWQRAQDVPYSTKKRFIDFHSTAIYPPTFYLAQAVAIKVARLMHMQPLTIFYLARVMNACTSWWALAMALTLAQELSVYLGVLLLFPVVLQQLGTLSPDAGMIVCVVWLCVLLRQAATAASAQPKVWFWITAIIALLAQARPPLMALAALLWLPSLARHARIGVNRQRLACTLVVMLLALPWSVGCAAYGVSLRPDLPSVHDKALQLLHDPEHFLALLRRTTWAHADGYLFMLVGYLGWFDAPISTAAFDAALVAAGCGLALALRRAYRLTAADACAVWTAIVGSYVAMQLIFYLTWTPQNAVVIEGFQGRYAMMFLPLLPFGLPRVPWPRWAQAVMRAIALLAILRALSAVPWTLLQRYYLSS